MTVPARVSLLTLGVADVARATAFYEALGWQRSSASNDDITFLHTVGPVLALFGRQALADDAGVGSDGTGFAGVTMSINVDSRDAVDAAFAAWVAAGGSPVKDPHGSSWGGYVSYVADPDGHLWEITHNPYFPIDAEGRVTAPD